MTVAPSFTRISVSVPATGEGISASTLSVEISKIGSSRETVSPMFLSHLVMVPSVMDSPICGIVTSVPGPAAVGASGAGGGIAASTAAVASAAGVDESAFRSGTEAVAAAGAEPASSIVQTTVLICTVAPSWILIWPITPAVGEGISASTLSVEISNSGSSRSTGSPVFFNHLVRVPSVMDSPIWGMTTSVGIRCPSLMKNAVLRPRIIRLGVDNWPGLAGYWTPAPSTCSSVSAQIICREKIRPK